MTFAATVVVVTVNVAVAAPWATVTFAGTEAAALLLERLTTTPPGGSGPDERSRPPSHRSLHRRHLGLTERAIRFAPNVGDVGQSEPRTHALRGLASRTSLYSSPAAACHLHLRYLSFHEWLLRVVPTDAVECPAKRNSTGHRGRAVVARFTWAGKTDAGPLDQDHDHTSCSGHYSLRSSFSWRKATVCSNFSIFPTTPIQ